AVKGALAGAFENGGQACIAGSRAIVERPVHDAFVERLVARTRELRVGPGLDEATDVGAIVSAEQRDSILGHVEAAERAGAGLVAGGRRIGDRGHFLEPAVLTGATPDMGIWREEVFGPVVTVTPFDGADEGVALANDTRYGLAAAVWTGDAGRGIALARRLRAGTVWVNEYGAIRPEVPFGGFGESGVGRELGALGLDAYTEPKSVFVAL
ncbi:MAG TPA: aldehyde dehydrogenase family protein, partial [Solirubrobacteraceae bacterium]|nr:aldehyde dehydrogenase family protein [Solirubrobacteraceae bacterium]